MRSSSGRNPIDDLTTKARIRDAAISQIAQIGFGASTVRSIAAAAGVSAALVVHHFGSKDGLRQACDEHVAAVFGEYVKDAEAMSTARILTEMAAQASSEEISLLTAYCVRALIDGGDLAQKLFDTVVDDTAKAMRAGVEAGLIKPAIDETGRARMLTATSLGAAVMARYLYPAEADPVAAQRLLRAEVTVPGLELYTYGLFTDDSLLAEFRKQQPDPEPTAAPAPGAPTAGDQGPPDSTTSGAKVPAPVPSPTPSRKRQ